LKLQRNGGKGKERLSHISKRERKTLKRKEKRMKTKMNERKGQNCKGKTEG
jgi:hypothetical protein